MISFSVLEKDETFVQIRQLQNDIEEILTTDVFNINKNKNNEKQDNINNGNINEEKNKNTQETINEKICEEKIKDVIPENKFTNYYEVNE